MSDSVPSLADINLLCRGPKMDPEVFERAIFAYSLAHDPAVKAAREAMELILAASDSGKGVYEAREAANSALRLLGGKAVPHE